jgi:hypothetical protein
MAKFTTTFTRRGLAFALGGFALAPRAFAAPAPNFPLSVGYARIAETGFIPVRLDEQAYWSAMQARTGGLVDAIEPIQLSDIMGGGAPEVDGGANCAMVARQIAAGMGLSHVILYATQDGRKIYPADNWMSKSFASLRSEYLKYDRASGEAHLLDVAGGPAVASVSADVKPRDPLNLFDNNRNPERETLHLLTQGLEQRLQRLARPQYKAERSIAD